MATRLGRLDRLLRFCYGTWTKQHAEIARLRGLLEEIENMPGDHARGFNRCRAIAAKAKEVGDAHME